MIMLFLSICLSGLLFTSCSPEIRYRDRIVEVPVYVDPTAWLGEPPGHTTADVTRNTDIVVIGAGASGLAAARAAAERLPAAAGSGTNVIIVDRGPSLHSRGIVFGAVNTNWQRELCDLSTAAGGNRIIRNIAEKNEIARVMWQISGHRASLAQWTRFVHQSGSAFDWYEDALLMPGSPWATGVPAAGGVAAVEAAIFNFPTMGPQKGDTALVAQEFITAAIPGITGAGNEVTIRNHNYPWFSTSGNNRRGFYLQFAWPGAYPGAGIMPQLPPHTSEIQGIPHFHAFAHNFQHAGTPADPFGMSGNWTTALRSQQWAAHERGAQFLFLHEAQELIVNADGEVVGVWVEDLMTGDIVRINAREVILATGDYGANAAMVRALNPEWVTVTGALTGGPARNDGLGHRMAIWAGAMMEPGPHGHMTHAQGGVGGAFLSTLVLNEHGQRFMNENSSPYFYTLQVGRQPHRSRIHVADIRFQEMVPHTWAPFHGAPDVYNLSFMELMNPAGGHAHLEALVTAMYPAGTATGAGVWAFTRTEAEAQRHRANALASIIRYNELAGYVLIASTPVAAVPAVPGTATTPGLPAVPAGNSREWTHVTNLGPTFPTNLSGIPAGTPNPASGMNRNDWEQANANSKDLDFGKQTRMWALTTPPFFMGRSANATGMLKGGLMVTPEHRVRRAIPIGGAAGEAGWVTPGEPIPGLWAVGNVSGGYFAGAYAINAAATSHGTAITMGRMAGHLAAGGPEADLITVPGGATPASLAAAGRPARPAFSLPPDANDPFTQQPMFQLGGTVAITSSGGALTGDNAVPSTVGHVLTAVYTRPVPGHLGDPGAAVPTWQWIRSRAAGEGGTPPASAVVISGANSNTYTITAADVGFNIRAMVTYTTHAGSVMSAPTGVVVAAP